MHDGVILVAEAENDIIMRSTMYEECMCGEIMISNHLHFTKVDDDSFLN